MKIIRNKNKEWQEFEGYGKKILLDDENLQNGSVVQEIRVKAGKKVGEHYHKKQTEVFYFFSNEGYWIINEEKYEFEAGDILVIEPNDRHTVINEDSKDYVYLAIKYNYNDRNDSFWV